MAECAWPNSGRYNSWSAAALAWICLSNREVVDQRIGLSEAFEICPVPDRDAVAGHRDAIRLKTLEGTAEIFGSHAKHRCKPALFEFEVEGSLAARTPLLPEEVGRVC